jgi:hypothetical protein
MREGIRLMEKQELKDQALKVINALVGDAGDLGHFAATPEAAATLAKLRDRLQGGFAQLRFEPRSQSAGDGLVVTTGRFMGEHAGVLKIKGMGFQPTGRMIATEAVVGLTFDSEGLVSAYDGMFDFKTVLLQMGAQFVLPAEAGRPQQTIAMVDGRPNLITT